MLNVNGEPSNLHARLTLVVNSNIGEGISVDYSLIGPNFSKIAEYRKNPFASVVTKRFRIVDDIQHPEMMCVNYRLLWYFKFFPFFGRFCEEY